MGNPKNQSRATKRKKAFVVGNKSEAPPPGNLRSKKIWTRKSLDQSMNEERTVDEDN